ncbi:hypothetical protein MMC25_005795 [Agyrium rufum]|nr:hypothetical protein [Agyrium rufum]
MVKIGAVGASVSTFVNAQSLVAVFVGGTSGIGSYATKELAVVHGKSGKGLRVYIVGRKASTAEAIIAECRQLCPSGQFTFVKVENGALLSNVDGACSEIMRREEEESKKSGEVARIDLLVISAAYFTWEPRTDTKEGLDAQMSLLYYSRIRYINKLLPLLLDSSLPTGAHVISVYAAGFETKLFPEDLSLRYNYGFDACRSHCVHMTTLYMEQLAERHPGKLSLVHEFPGLVYSRNYDRTHVPGWFVFLYETLGLVISKIIGIPSEQSGQRTLFLATDRFPARGFVKSEPSPTKDIAMGTGGKVGSGAYSVGQLGDTIPQKKLDEAYGKHDKQQLSQKVWEHTNKAFEVIEKGGVFLE